MKKAICFISKKEYPIDVLIKGGSIRTQLFDQIKVEHPDFSVESYISRQELYRYRKKYLEEVLKNEIGELSALEEEVVKSISAHQLLSENIEDEIETELTFGQRLADRIAEFGGSWIFLICFFSFLLLWMITNVWILATKPFDPYPFILLNLILSCLAAIQAPIIMMSQNRQSQKDRTRSEHDYKINLKAELEIQLLHEKIDHLMLHQNKRLIEIQEIQLDYLEELIELNKSIKSTQG